MVNTLRSDVDDVTARIQHQMTEAARLRVADDKTTHEILDELKSRLSARFLDWFKTGQFAEAVAAMGQTVPEDKKPSTNVQFPTGT